VTTPNFDALSRYALGVDWAVLSPLEHVYYFTEATLARLLAEAGFSAITAMREQAGRGPVETMNFGYTNAPGTIRNRLYGAAVTRFGARIYRAVQRAGRADALLCVSRANDSADAAAD
jgi:hypothetical protein